MSPARNSSSPAVGTWCPHQQFRRWLNFSAEWLGVAEIGGDRDSGFIWFWWVWVQGSCGMLIVGTQLLFFITSRNGPGERHPKHSWAVQGWDWKIKRGMYFLATTLLRWPFLESFWAFCTSYCWANSVGALEHEQLGLGSAVSSRLSIYLNWWCGK